MWPVLFAFGSRFSRYLVLPIAGVIGTIGYYAEKKLMPKQKPIEYLGSSVKEQREQRQLNSSSAGVNDTLLHPSSLNVLKPKAVET